MWSGTGADRGTRRGRPDADLLLAPLQVQIYTIRFKRVKEKWQERHFPFYTTGSHLSSSSWSETVFPPRGWKRAEKQVNDGVNIHFIAQEKKVISLYKSPLQLLSMISIFFFYIYLAYLVQNRTLFCWKHKIKTRRFKSVNASLSLVTEHLHTTRGCRRQRGSSPLREHRLTAPCIVTHVNS